MVSDIPSVVTGGALGGADARPPGKARRRAARQWLDSLGRFDANVGCAGWWIEVEAELRLPGGRLLGPGLSGWGVLEQWANARAGTPARARPAGPPHGAGAAPEASRTA
jgi:hypothetical protein